METFNLTEPEPSTLILNGIPGLEYAHIWISIPFSMFYFISLLGNSVVLFVIVKELTLHKPMFLLICMLALTDIGMSTAVIPKTLCIFWFGLKDITLDGCLTQMFFFQVFVGMHSAVLVTMAFDRYLAIADPLRYTTLLSNAKTAKLGLLGLAISAFLAVPEHLALRKLPFCANRVIPHTYCEHMAVVKMSCSDTTVSRSITLIMTFVIIGLDMILIGISYGMIIRAVLNLHSKEANQKALSTCSSHICVILMSFTSALFSSLTHRFGQGIAAHVHILLPNFHILIPPMLHPFIYGIKTKELREKLRKYACTRRSRGVTLLIKTQ